ncbi:MAG: Hsp33 family molecular chaperone HslO [Pseudomonadota bacterium]
MKDQLTRFMFDEHDVRGELVQLDQTVIGAVDNRHYPACIEQLVGEMLAATSLLTAVLKFKGEVSLQIQSQGIVKYAVVHSTHMQTLKSVVRYEENVELSDATFTDLFEKGYLVITISPEQGERYQGIISLDKPTLAQCIEHYFDQSEQLPTKLYLFCGKSTDTKALGSGGLFLQVIPTTSETSMQNEVESMNHLDMLAETTQLEEILTLSNEALLFRLFHQDSVRILDVNAVEYACDCSLARTAQALQHVDKKQLETILKEDGVVKMDCHYCDAVYEFDEVDIKNIMSGKYSFLSGDDLKTH